jgi:elongation factor P
VTSFKTDGILTDPGDVFPVGIHRKGTFPMYTAADLRKGLKITIDGDPYIVTAFEFSKPGKGQALYRTKMRNMINGTSLDRTYRSGETFEPAHLEERTMQYLYKEDTNYCFMDNQNYEQISISEDGIGEARNYLIDNLEVEVLMFQDKPIGVSTPNFVNLRVVKTDPWLKGDTTGSDSKPATLETGYVLRVPPFIEEGELITIDTRTGEYSTRVKG